ncbi:MAG: hypothetical protein ACTSWI_01680 [Alphaproteobacteria bacterium]
MADRAQKVSRVAISTPARTSAIAFGSVIPLALNLAAIFWGGIGRFTESEAAIGFVGYAGLLLVFIAGARFGHSVRASRASGVIVAAAAMAAALASIYLPAQIAAGVLAAAHAGHGAWDVWSADRALLPAWYGRLRLQTTLVAVPLLVVGVFALERI